MDLYHRGISFSSPVSMFATVPVIDISRFHVHNIASFSKMFPSTAKKIDYSISAISRSISLSELFQGLSMTRAVFDKDQIVDMFHTADVSRNGELDFPEVKQQQSTQPSTSPLKVHFAVFYPHLPVDRQVPTRNSVFLSETREPADCFEIIPRVGVSDEAIRL